MIIYLYPVCVAVFLPCISVVIMFEYNYGFCIYLRM